MHKAFDHQIQRGDIFYVKDSEKHKPTGYEMWSNRPALIVSNDALNHTSQGVSVVYLSTSPKKRLSPTHVEVTSGNKKAMALCEQVHPVDISRLRNYIGTATDDEMKEVDMALMFHLGINHGTNPQGIFKKWENYLRTYNIFAKALAH